MGWNPFEICYFVCPVYSELTMFIVFLASMCFLVLTNSNKAYVGSLSRGLGLSKDYSLFVTDLSCIGLLNSFL